MKSLITFFLCLTAALGWSLPLHGHLAAVARKKAAGGGGGNLTVDVWQTFEGALDAAGLGGTDSNASATWAVVGAGKAVDAAGESDMLSTINSTADTGTQGVKFDHATLTGSVSCDLNTYPTAQSVGFWIKFSAFDNSTTEQVYSLGEGIGGNAICSFRISRSGTDYTCHLYNTATTTASGSIALATGSWFWITVKFVSGGTCLLQAYDAAGAQVGTEQSVTGATKATYYHIFNGTTALTTGERYFDDLVIDKDADTYPLLP